MSKRTPLPDRPLVFSLARARPARGRPRGADHTRGPWQFLRMQEMMKTAPPPLAKVEDVPRAKAVVGGHRQPDGPANLGNFLNGHLVLVVRKPRASILLRHQHPQQSQFPHLSKQLPREMLTLIPFHAVGQDFSLDKISDALAHQLLVSGQCQLHVFLSLRTTKVGKVR